MNSFTAIQFVCLVGAIFAMGALAGGNSETTESAALKKDSKILLGLAERFENSPLKNQEDEQWFPIIGHYLRSIERTRRDIISEAMDGKPTKGKFVAAHRKAYEAIDEDLTKLIDALDKVGEKKVATDLVKLFTQRLEQAE